MATSAVLSRLTLHDVQYARGDSDPSNIAASIAQLVGVHSDGFQTTVLPEAIAWAIAIDAMSVGSCTG